MTTDLDICADVVRDCLDRGIGSHDDFAAIAIAGERLRRACPLKDNLPRAIEQALAEFDAFLDGYDGDVPNIEESIDIVLDGLTEYASSSALRRDPFDGQRWLADLDSTTCVAAAARRANKLDDTTLGRLAERAAERVTSLATSLSELWQAAADRQIAYLPDPDYPQLSAWLEELASLAPSRVDTELALQRQAHYELLRSAMVQRESLRQGLQHLAVLVAATKAVRVLAVRRRAFFADEDQSLPELDTVYEFGDELGVLRGDTYLVVWVREGRRLDVTSAQADGSILATEAESADMVRVDLPESWSQITLRVRVDDEDITLPQISLIADKL